jgi:hypothetical protein
LHFAADNISVYYFHPPPLHVMKTVKTLVQMHRG